MEEKKYLTIAEVATRTNRSTQSIYKRLSTTLQPYVVNVGNKRMLDISVLEALENNPVGNAATNVGNQDNNVGNVEQPIVDILKQQLDVMNKQVELLQQQLETKDKQIENLDKRLDQALKNSSESHFVLAQHQHNALPGAAAAQPIAPWYKRLFRPRKEATQGGESVE